VGLVGIDTGKDKITGTSSLEKEKEAKGPSPANPANLTNLINARMDLVLVLVVLALGRILVVVKVVKEAEAEVMMNPLSCQLALLVQLQLRARLLDRLSLLLSRRLLDRPSVLRPQRVLPPCLLKHRLLLFCSLGLPIYCI